MSEWQRTVLQDPRAVPTQAMVRHAVNDSLRQKGLHPVDCMTTANLIGRFELQFAADVVSEPNVVHVGRWSLAQIAEGSPLPDDVVGCMEEMLPPPTDVAAPTPGMFMSSYEGPMTIDFAIDLEPEPAAATP